MEVLYRQRCQYRTSPTELLAETTFADIDALERAWIQERKALDAYLQNLDDPDLERLIEYRSIAGEPRQNRLWQMLVQVINHGTQTYAEAAIILTQYGSSPGNIDLIYFLK